MKKIIVILLFSTFSCTTNTSEKEIELLKKENELLKREQALNNIEEKPKQQQNTIRKDKIQIPKYQRYEIDSSSNESVKQKEFDYNKPEVIQGIETELLGKSFTKGFFVWTFEDLNEFSQFYIKKVYKDDFHRVQFINISTKLTNLKNGSQYYVELNLFPDKYGFRKIKVVEFIVL